MKNITSLNGAWNLYYYNEEEILIENPSQLKEKGVCKIPASVPGNVELDLANADVISKELFKGMATVENAKFEDYDWWYEKEFTIHEPFQRVFLLFGGVDLFAEYYLNGKKVYESDNAFMEIKFEVTDDICVNEVNKLQIHIRSTAKYAFRQKYNLYLSQCRPGYQTYTRKAAHAFGWDIFPRAISAGLWRDVAVITDDGYDFEECSYFVESANDLSATIHFQVSVDAPYQAFKKNVSVRITGECKDHSFSKILDLCHFKAGRLKLVLKNPYLWWPYGYGNPDVYDLKFELLIDGEVKAEKMMNMGVRTAKLRRTETMLEENHCFQFVINGTDVMCRGNNWVPLDAYHSRSKEKYQETLKLFADIHCNMIRVWGGGVYEEEAFYDYCDRHGIMVWQDFMIACFPVSQDETTLRNLKSEIEWAIKTLRHHPSIVLWAGDNEVDERLSYSGLNTGINQVTRKLIPEIIEQNDACRAYLPSSPYLSERFSERYANRQDIFPERHLWGARDYYKEDFYKNSKAHFVSETGYWGCPCLETVQKMVDEEYLWPIFNEQWILHSSDQNGNKARLQSMWDQIRQMFAFEPDNIKDFILASQISQAEADKFSVERIRNKKPYTSGILLWNMKDGWPEATEALVDYFGKKKLAYDYVKRSQQPVALMFEELHAWNYKLYVTNDTRETVRGSYEVFDIDTNEVLLCGDFVSKANENQVLGRARMMYSEKRFLVIQWNIDGKTYYNHYLCGMPPFDFKQYCEWLERFSKLCQ